MSYATFSVSLGWTAVSIGVIGTFAQLRRVAVNGVAGVSRTTWLLFVLMGCFWISYGFSAHSIEVIMGSVLCLPIQAAIIFRLRAWEQWRSVAQASAIFVVLCVAPTIAFGWAGGVYGTGVAMTVNRVPQFIELIRESDATGVSAGSWFLGVAGSFCWVMYYTGVHLWAPLVSTAAAGMASLCIALMATWRHTQARQSMIADEVFAVRA